jgi:hypothetical protein
MLLERLFEYPDILRQPTAAVLSKFVAAGTPLVAVWYALALTAVAFVPLTLLFHRVLAERGTTAILWVATAFGLIAGLSQTLGFLRWPFLVPYLAQAYLAPGTSEAQRAAAAMAFDAFHRYAGMAVGEHLGYLSTSIWTVLIALHMLRTAFLPRWVAAIGVLLAIGIATGLAEPAGWEPGGMINALSYLAWAAWLISLGLTLLVAKDNPHQVAPPAPRVRQAQTSAL